MPRKDPFADKRKTQPGGRSKQAAQSRNRKKSRDQKRKMKATKDKEEAERQLSRTERKLEIKQHMLELMAGSPSPAEQRKIILGMFEEAGFNPIEELINHAKDPDIPARDRANITEKLASFYAAKPKTLDIQAEVSGGMNINVVDYSSASAKELERREREAEEARPGEAIDVSEYGEFIDPADGGSPENPENPEDPEKE